MIVKFIKLKLHNFMSFGDAEIELDQSGFTIVSGRNNKTEDLSKSNGSGKSSIWEGISYALTGDTIRGTKDIVNMNADDGAYVTLDFAIDGNKYQILRSKGSKDYGTSLKVVIDGKDVSGKGIRDTEKILSERLGDLNASLLGSVIILGQGLPQRFTNNTPAGRKEVLETLSKSDFMIEDIKSRISDRKQYLSNESDKLKMTRLMNEGKISVLQSNIDRIHNTLSELKDESEVRERISTLSEKVRNIEAEICGIDNSISDMEESVQKLRDEYVTISSQTNSKVADENAEMDRLLSPLTAKQSNITAQITILKNEIKRISQIKDVCPTCGQKIPNVVKPSTSDQEAQISALEYSLNGVCSDIENVKMLYENRLQMITDESNSRKNIVTDSANKIKKQIDEKKSVRTELTSKLSPITSALNAANVDLDTLLNRRNDMMKQCEDYKAEIDSIQSVLDAHISEELDVNQRLEIINKFDTIVKRDFRGYLLRNVIDYIDRKAKEYSKDVFGTELLSFTLDSNNIKISYDNKQYENLSGGERQKIDIIIQFALRDMLCQYLGFSSNIIVIDECFDNLDSTGSQKIINMISSKLKDVESVFVVTHHTDLSIPYDREITVVKDASGVSYIE